MRKYLLVIVALLIMSTPVLADVVSGRPSGCPRRFCGCWASIEVFGKIVPSLNLAANWLRFPRSHPAAGMVAARRGHVFVLREHRRGNVWLVSDGNSGGGKARLHERSISGFAVVNPHEASFASNASAKLSLAVW